LKTIPLDASVPEDLMVTSCAEAKAILISMIIVFFILLLLLIAKNDVRESFIFKRILSNERNYN
jgi:hypothetical protein